MRVPCESWAVRLSSLGVDAGSTAMVGVGRKSTTESVTSSRDHSARNGRLRLWAARLAVRVATICQL